MVMKARKQAQEMGNWNSDDCFSPRRADQKSRLTDSNRDHPQTEPEQMVILTLAIAG